MTPSLAPRSAETRMPDPVGDAEIRAALRKQIADLHPEARVVDEVAVRLSRIDVAAISTNFVGFEIKSWRDNLRKLDQQWRDYSMVFDYCNLVATVKHMDTAAAMVPEWWGLLLVSQNDAREVSFSPMRPMQPNPALSIKALAGLLWREELRAILDAHGVHRHSSKPKLHLIDLVHGCAPLADIRVAIIRTLRERKDWRDENGRAVDRFAPLKTSDPQPARIGKGET